VKGKGWRKHSKVWSLVKSTRLEGGNDLREGGGKKKKKWRLGKSTCRHSLRKEGPGRENGSGGEAKFAGG